MEHWESMDERAKLFVKLITITLSVYLSFRFILPLIWPFIFAYLLALIVRPVSELLYKRARIPRTIGGTASLVLLIFLISTGLFFLGNLLIKQAINFARNIPAYLSILAGKLDNICSNGDEVLGLAAGSVRTVMDDNILKVVDKLKTDYIPGMTARTFSFTIKVVGFVGILLITIISAILIVKEVPELRKKYKGSNIYKDINSVTEKLTSAGIAYMRAQLIIMALVAVACVTGLVIIRNEYALLLGILIAILDALPIIGSGIILIPWSIIMLINGNIFAAAILITVYLICQIIREVVEPKIIGNKIGIKPLYTLISMYMGLKLFGIVGFILGPIGLIIIISILKVINDKGNNGNNAHDNETTNNQPAISYSLDKGAELK